MSDRPVALITGASGGLGRVLAPDLASAGYKLAMLGSNQERLAATAQDLGLAADNHITAEVNLRDAAATAAAIELVYDRFGHVDALAHLVGGWTGGTSIADLDDEPVTSMIDQHLWTSFNVARSLSPRMVAAGRGRMVAVSSPIATRPIPGMAAYAIGKAALEALYRTLAEEVSGSGVTVNLVRVGTIDVRHERDTDPSDTNGSWTSPEEVSAAIRYLFSDAARVVNGEALDLDGAG